MKINKNSVISPKTWVEVSSSAIKSNIKVFAGLANKETALMAVVKSNAYGHGLVEVAKIAQNQGVKWFGVDSLEEGMMLRENGIEGSILVLGFIRPENLEIAIKNKLSFVAYEPKIILKLILLSKRGVIKKYPAKIHLKVETGTGRQGLAGKDLLQYALKLKKINGVEIEGLYTHYANIEDTTDPAFAMSQLENFNIEKSVLAKAGVEPKFCHTACSAAAVLFAQTHFNMIRMGISLYGLWSSKETRAVAQKMHKDIKLRPAMAWKTIIAQIKKYPKGKFIGYGLSERLTRASSLAVIPVGYWDGYDRKIASIGHVLIRGKRCKVIGRICMNMMMVDVTDVGNARVEDQVVLLGRQKNENISAEEFAGKINTINYEAVTRINPLLPRIVVD
ncbi:MAG: alanine racemase [Patescibacteria group bacterium]|jgi:alanine racemase